MKPKDKRLYIESVKRKFSLSSHITHETCRGCGNCCRRGGCGLLTCDVEDLSVEGIKKMLDTGKYSIAFFCAGTEEGFFDAIPMMSVREVGSGRVNTSIISRPCSLHTANGCPFSDDERPTLGQLLIADVTGNAQCHQLVDSMETLMDWYPYKEILEEVVMDETGRSSISNFIMALEDANRQIRPKVEANEELTSAEEAALQILCGTGAWDILND